MSAEQPIAIGVAFLVATTITWVELITDKYPHTPAFLKGCRCFYLYGLIYGTLAAAAFHFLGVLAESGAFRIEGLGMDNPYVAATAVGISVKALLHIRLFNVNKVPIGVETLVQVFEPWMLDTIDLFHNNAVARFLKPLANKYPNLQEVQEQAKTGIPPGFKQTQKAAIIVDLDQADTPIQALWVCMNYLGKGTVNRLFPG